MRALLLAIALAFGSTASAQEMTALPVAELSPPLPPIPEGFVTEPGISVDVYGRASQRAMLKAIGQRANSVLPQLAKTLGVPIGGHIVVYVASSDAEFAALQPGRPPEWAEGTAWADRGAVFLKSPAMSPEGSLTLFHVLDHEIVHILLGRAYAPHHPPHWLEEGLARNLAGEQGPDDTRRIAEGLSHGGLYTLENLHIAFPRDSVGASLAYAESADFVAFLRAEHGDDAMRALIGELAKGSNIDAAIYRATGETLGALDARWRARFTGPAFFLSGAFDVAAFAFGTAALGALVLRRRRLRDRMDKMAADEALRDALAKHAPPPAFRPKQAVGRLTRR